MNINPISFGRVVKLNQPIKIAQKIADIASNRNGIHELASDKKIQEIFQDQTETGVIAIKINSDKKSSYLVSGDEGEITRDILEELFADCENCIYDENDKQNNPTIERPCDRADKDLETLINLSKISKLKISFKDKSKTKIKSINFKA